MKVIVLLSGGIDSALCLLIALDRYKAEDVVAFHLFYGGTRLELEAARAFAKKHNVSFDAMECCPWSLREAGADDPYVIPHRNAVMITLAAARHPDATTIYFGATEEDYDDYRDCRPEFFNELGCALRFIVKTPLIYGTKAATVSQLQHRNVDLATLVSCYRGVRPGCGQCNSCRLRAKAGAPC